jgi:hypothetical protein
MMPSQSSNSSDFAALSISAMQLSTRRSSFGPQLHMPTRARRQHGHGAVGEVDAGAAQARFEVERGAGST